MRELIRHILKENRLQQELKQFIEDNNIFDAAEMVGGMDNLKSIFKDELEVSEILDELTGVVDFSYYEKYLNKNPILFSFKYEIIGIKKNRWNTNSWPELNLIYDEDKLSPSENETLKSIIAVIQNDNTTGKIKTKTLNFKDSNYFDIKQINGKDVDLHEDEYSFSKKDVIRIHDKLYGESESLNESSNESEKDLKKLLKITKMIMEDLILPSYNHLICSYEITLNEVFNIPEVTVLFIGGYGTEYWPMTQAVRDMYIEVLDDISKEIATYTGVVIGVRGEQTSNCNEEENSFLNENKLEEKNKNFIKNKLGIDFDGKIELVQSAWDLPWQTFNFISNDWLKRFMNNHGPCYLMKINKEYILYNPLWIAGNGDEGLVIDSEDGLNYTEREYLEKIKIGHTGISLKIIVDLFFNEEDSDEVLNENEDYSPAGKEITPNQIVVHKSNPKFRDKIMENGLKVRAGECYKIYVGYGVKCKPAIFATNSTNKRAWFDSTYDDDIWFIDTTKIPDVKWFKDRHFESRSKHIVTFQDIPKEAITLKYEGTGSSEDVLNSWPEDSPNRLQESIKRILRENSLKNDLMESEDKKLKLVKEMIYNLFDEVEFIEVDTNYEGKPLIKVFHDVEDTAANYDNWFTHRIIDKIMELTGDGIILSPWWAAGWDWKYKNADLYIDVQKIKYDDEGNVINESDESKRERKFNKLIQNVEDYLNSNEYPSVKKFMLYYDEQFDDVIVNIFFDPVESVKLGGGINSVIKRVGRQIMKDLDVFPLSFKYHIHFDRDINESKEKQPKYLNIIKDIVEPFKDEDCVCDVRVLYNEEHDMYLIDLNMGTEELNDKFIAVIGMNHYVSKLRRDIKETIKDYLPIDNFYVGSYASPNCKWKPLNESDNKEQSLQKLIDQYGLYEFIKMSGLDFNQVKSILNKMDNPKQIIKQYIREYVLEHDSIPGENYGSLIGLKIPLSNTKYVNDIMVQDSDQIAVEIWEYYEDNYGQRITKDQYLTTINSLTNKELLSILSWMMETIEIGYWD